MMITENRLPGDGIPPTRTRKCAFWYYVISLCMILPLTVVSMYLDSESGFFHTSVFMYYLDAVVLALGLWWAMAIVREEVEFDGHVSKVCRTNSAIARFLFTLITSWGFWVISLMNYMNG